MDVLLIVRVSHYLYVIIGRLKSCDNDVVV